MVDTLLLEGLAGMLALFGLAAYSHEEHQHHAAAVRTEAAEDQAERAPLQA